MSARSCACPGVWAATAAAIQTMPSAERDAQQRPEGPVEQPQAGQDQACAEV